jgi:hypothetical protein
MENELQKRQPLIQWDLEDYRIQTLGFFWAFIHSKVLHSIIQENYMLFPFL